MLYPETDHVLSQAEHRIKHDQPSRLISKEGVEGTKLLIYQALKFVACMW